MVLVTFRRQAGKQLYKQLPDAFYYPRIQFFNFTADSSMCFFLFFLLFAHVVFFCLRDVDAALSLAPVEQTQRHRRRRCSRDLYWLVVVSTSFPGFTQTSWEDTHGCDSRSLS